MSIATSNQCVVLNPHDNICVATTNLSRGDTIQISDQSITMKDKVALGHKIATREILLGELVLKYGQVIGKTTRSVQAGQWVHSHNLASDHDEIAIEKSTNIPPPLPPITDRTFMGIRRSSGKVGTRNYVAVISSVNCSATVSKRVARHFDQEQLRNYPNVDGVIALTYQAGCGIQWQGLTHRILNRVLSGFAQHPNVGAYLLVGLGCEQMSIDFLVEDRQLIQIDSLADQGNAPRPPVFIMQNHGGTRKTVEAAIKEVERLLPLANQVQREECPASELILATECGGSDGNSGVTANPAVGIAADLMVRSGATAILAETTEIYGAEHLLTQRARRPEVADKLIERINWWKWYADVFGGVLDNNPSVGNKLGGLTTIAEKSLGAVAKGGSTALEAVYEYAELVTQKGLVIMDTPGFDPPSVTGMVAGGANVVVFTTGRGSCFGCKPVPSIKIASNSPMFEQMHEDMDINAGTILAGKSVDQVGEEIFDEVLEVASGKKTKSEQQGIGDEEYAPWVIGPTL